MTERKTSLLDELKKGPWPSLLLLMAEKHLPKIFCSSWNNHSGEKGHWKHGGIEG